jgi:hypothetical protein
MWIPFERKGDYDDIDYHGHRMRRLIGGLCVLLCVLLVFAVLVLGLATLITYLVLRPRTTHYTVVSASVPTLDVQGASTSLTTTSTVDAQFDYGVELRNPNRHVTMEYTNLNVATLYLATDIGHSGVHLGGLRVGHRSSYTVPVTTSATSLQVNNIVGDALRSDIGQQSVTVQVRIDTRARAHIGSYTSFWIWLHSICNVNVSPPNGGVAGTLQWANCHKT